LGKLFAAAAGGGGIDEPPEGEGPAGSTDGSSGALPPWRSGSGLGVGFDCATTGAGAHDNSTIVAKIFGNGCQRLWRRIR
jgi:hypothetical protein